MKLEFLLRPSHRKPGYFSYVVEILLLFAIYFSTAKLGLSFDAVSRFATLGVSSLLLGRVIAFSTYSPTWRAWWIGDMISILIVTPLLLTWSKWPHAKVSGKRLVEIGILTVFVLAVGLIVFLGLLHTDQRNYPLTYLVFPPLIWAALRFGPRGALSAIFALSILAVLGTIQGVVSYSTDISERSEERRVGKE